MREIKFRGKRVDTGEWAYGNYIYRYECSPVPDRPDEYECHYIQEQDFAGTEYEVDPETVGQYTGRKDKNDKEIYEGDIVRLRHNGLSELFLVVWRNFGFTLKPLTHSYCKQYTVSLVFNETEALPEILGNIHDNPKLIEREEKQP
jgi:uncharacterized phage protein (TIGR01671 family)